MIQLSNKEITNIIEELPSYSDLVGELGIKLAAIITRVSDQKQKGNNSLRTQLKLCLEKARIDGKVVCKEFVFVEEGVSGYRNKVEQRPILSKLKTLLFSEIPISAVYVFDISRLDRTGNEFLTKVYIPLVRVNKKVNFFDVKNDKFLDHKDPKTIQDFISSNQESSTKSKSTLTAIHTAMTEERNDLGVNNLPYGYKRDVDGTIYIDEYEAGIVKFVYVMYRCGHGMKSISMFLEEMKVPTSTGKGKWSSPQIKNILENEKYIGTHSCVFKKGDHKGKKFKKEGFFEQIVPKNLYDIVSQMKDFKDTFGKLESEFLVAGKVFCTNCNSLKKTTNSTPSGSKKSYRHYCCENEKTHRIDSEILNNEVLKRFKKKISIEMNNDGKLLQKNMKLWQIEIKKAIALKEKELLICRHNRDKAKNDGALQVVEIIQNEILKIRDEILHLNAALERVTSFSVSGSLQKFVHEYGIETLSKVEQRLFLLQFVKRVNVIYVDSCADIKVEFDMTGQSFFQDVPLRA